MEPVELETRRLVLRCPRAGDGGVVHASVVESLAALRRFPASLPWALEEPTVEASERYCREACADFTGRKAFAFLAFAKGGGDHVANLALHHVEWTVPKCELGYWVRSSFAGRGLMTEAAAALIAFGFGPLGMRRIEALPESGNHASRRVCERAGLELEGIRRNDRAEPDGSLVDTCVYAAVR